MTGLKLLNSITYCFGLMALLTFAHGQIKDIPPDYEWHADTGSAYKLVKVAQTWAKARALCEREGATFAVPDTQEEFAVLQRIVRQMRYSEVVESDHRLVVWLGVNNLADYRVWRSVHGQDIRDTRFHVWAGHNGIGYSNDPDEPHCAVIDAHNRGLRDWWCHKKLAYICEFIPVTRDGTTS